MGQLRRVEHRDVEIAAIKPNPWNYRGMSQAMFEKEVTSFRTFGYINPILTRRHPSGEGFEIIDGEHRWKAAQHLGITEIDLVELVDDETGEPIDERTAKKLTIVLNETHGDVRYDDLGKLVATLDAEGGHRDLLEQLPFPDAELKALLALFDDTSRAPEPEPEPEVEEKDEVKKDYVDDWELAQIRLPPGAREVLEKAVMAATEDTKKMPKEVRLGVGIERIAEAFLATHKVTNGSRKSEAPPAPTRRRRKAEQPADS